VGGGYAGGFLREEGRGVCKEKLSQADRKKSQGKHNGWHKAKIAALYI